MKQAIARKGHEAARFIPRLPNSNSERTADLKGMKRNLKETRKESNGFSCNPAVIGISFRPVTLRPHLSMGLPISNVLAFQRTHNHCLGRYSQNFQVHYFQCD